MRGTKRFSNTTFTKRVDHDQGLRPVRSPEEPAVCEVCGAVYADRRWVAATAAHDGSKHKEWRPATHVICPACKQEHGGVPCGFVHMEGPCLAEHADEIERLLHNEAARATEDNPLARIMGWQRKPGRLTVTTTTEHLAQRLGHAMEKAFKGKTRYSFSHENKLTRVSWTRD